MKLTQPNAEVFAPDGADEGRALARVTHLIVGAHQDDVEFMGFPLIRDAYGASEPRLGAIVMTNGAGSPRSGVYASCSDADMQTVRRREQRLAAELGRYAVVAQLQFPSCDLRSPANTAPTDELVRLLDAMRPDVLMTHNLADKHDTHVATALRVVQALRALPRAARPRRLLGGEIWRGLDWLPDAEKIRLDAGGHDSLAAALMGCFDSQIAGGKRYDRATFGRRHANATYGDPHAVDDQEQVAFAMDMTPLLADDALDPTTFVLGFVDRFANELRAALTRAAGGTP